MPQASCTGDPQHWAAAQRHHCCVHQHVGCATTTTAPTRDCETICAVTGQLHSCRKRVAYVAREAFAHQPEACRKALAHVRRECEVCSGCGLEEAQCEAGMPRALEWGLSRFPEALPVVTKPFDCAAALSNARHATRLLVTCL